MHIVALQAHYKAKHNQVRQLKPLMAVSLYSLMLLNTTRWMLSRSTMWLRCSLLTKSAGHVEENIILHVFIFLHFFWSIARLTVCEIIWASQSTVTWGNSHALLQSQYANAFAEKHWHCASSYLSWASSHASFIFDCGDCGLGENKESVGLQLIMSSVCQQ